MASSKVTPQTHVIIEGARVHNLKNVSVNIPRNALTVVTGLSGSGKSLFTPKDNDAIWRRSMPTHASS